MAFHCAAHKCSNGGYQLNKWKKQFCEVCGCFHAAKQCTCAPPFRLFSFPTKKRKPQLRERWKMLIGRQNGKKVWSPSKDSRVCSEHFVEGQPTCQNPFPTKKLGYDGSEKRVKRMLHFPDTQRPVKRVKLEKKRASQDNVPNHLTPDPDMEFPAIVSSLPFIYSFLAVFVILCLTLCQQRKKVASLNAEVISLKAQLQRLKQTIYTDKILKTNEDVTFYTGLQNKGLFEKLHALISPYVNRRWLGVKSLKNKVRLFKGNTARFGPSRKMSSKSEFLMTLMKLRLGLLSKDLSKRFAISETLCSRIFFAWLRACSIILKPMIYVPDQDALIGSKPQRFRSLPDLHSIIDCTELFIETPKDLELQSATWSDYKHHNTVKLLIACSPNSSIIFISPAYTGRISDKALTLHCGYLDKVHQYSMIMADKGFNIAKECNDRNLTVYVPPGRRGESQMRGACVTKTTKIANHRILVEQVIRRLKTFRILANEIPLSLIGHIDEIACVCGALSNLKEPIYKI